MIDSLYFIYKMMFAQIFKVLFFISLLIIEVLFFNIDANYAFRAVIGALVGGLVLNYFDVSKPNHQKITWLDATIKILLSSLSSLFLTPAVIKYFQVQDLDYVGVSYFLMSLVALVILKALYSLTEKNAKDVIINIFSRTLNIETKPQQKERFRKQLNKTE